MVRPTTKLLTYMVTHFYDLKYIAITNVATRSLCLFYIGAPHLRQMEFSCVIYQLKNHLPVLQLSPAKSGSLWYCHPPIQALLPPNPLPNLVFDHHFERPASDIRWNILRYLQYNAVHIDWFLSHERAVNACIWVGVFGFSLLSEQCSPTPVGLPDCICLTWSIM